MCLSEPSVKYITYRTGPANPSKRKQINNCNQDKSQSAPLQLYIDFTSLDKLEPSCGINGLVLHSRSKFSVVLSCRTVLLMSHTLVPSPTWSSGVLIVLRSSNSLSGTSTISIRPVIDISLLRLSVKLCVLVQVSLLSLTTLWDELPCTPGNFFVKSFAGTLTVLRANISLSLRILLILFSSATWNTFWKLKLKEFETDTSRGLYGRNCSAYSLQRCDTM